MRNIKKKLLELAKKIPFLREKISKKKVSNSGLTMIELLIVLAIVGVLIVVMYFGMRGQMQKGRDSKRKDDLQKIKVAYENYYSDNDCYPPDDALSNPDSTYLEPYMSSVPRDPLTDEPYVYIPLPDLCPGYRLFATLENASDPSIEQLRCLPTMCGYGDSYMGVNYGVAVGTQVPEDGFNPDDIEGEGSSPSNQYVINVDQRCIAIEVPGANNCANSSIHDTMLECLISRQACYPYCGKCTN
jgi:prepilin-type N-terminal cleavage/methylation domain-containing protein